METRILNWLDGAWWHIFAVAIGAILLLVSMVLVIISLIPERGDEPPYDKVVHNPDGSTCYIIFNSRIAGDSISCVPAGSTVTP